MIVNVYNPGDKNLITPLMEHLQQNVDHSQYHAIVRYPSTCCQRLKLTLRISVMQATGQLFSIVKLLFSKM